jgi:ankyrin repeat protein
MYKLINHRTHYHLHNGDTDMHRLWRASAHYLMDGLTTMSTSSATDENALARFLIDYRYSGAIDYGQHGKNVAPLLCAACEGNAPVTRALLEAHGDPNLGYQGNITIPYLALNAGVTPLAYATAVGQDEATICELLKHGADPQYSIPLGENSVRFTCVHAL